MYTNIIQIKDPLKRRGIINTCLASIEYVSSAKRAGIYSYLLNYIATVNSGGTAPSLPGEHNVSQQSTQQQQTLTVPRSMQPNFQAPGATHPSLINAKTSSYNQHRQQNSACGRAAAKPIPRSSWSCTVPGCRRSSDYGSAGRGRCIESRRRGTLAAAIRPALAAFFPGTLSSWRARRCTPGPTPAPVDRFPANRRQWLACRRTAARRRG